MIGLGTPGQSARGPGVRGRLQHNLHDAVGRVVPVVDRTRRVVTAHGDLLTPDGPIITGWVGRFPEDQVLELAAGYTAGCNRDARV